MSESRALSDVLDRLEAAVDGDEITVQEIIERLGRKSFASVMLIFSLISTSPASAIPGVTAVVAAITFLLAAQIILGRDHLWLPGLITRRRLSTDKLCKGIGWLRRPVHFVERFLKTRLAFLFHRPWFYLPLVLIMALTLLMPFMELVPTSGSIASAVIALFAAGLLTRDGALVVASMLLLLGVPLAIWKFGFS
ncbi:exopolysaccharide biosynthesis protein exod [Pelagivirga sediminicola]|uniref:Exopolysaccharide biosynthesis protein exod n=1 Tax=Pelagivirga sediminicola TaxID=2170575 RepID=A0A2T7G9C5_9RHOB|nr:exopolysaccharide biosynthesis protein [Pelagivirga sediminicola]PVA11013.1 exopolysaccharide biosynthesis protein exod [Pelagivirga sediminicola]